MIKWDISMRISKISKMKGFSQESREKNHIKGGDPCTNQGLYGGVTPVGGIGLA